MINNNTCRRIEWGCGPASSSVSYRMFLQYSKTVLPFKQWPNQSIIFLSWNPELLMTFLTSNEVHRFTKPIWVRYQFSTQFQMQLSIKALEWNNAILLLCSDNMLIFSDRGHSRLIQGKGGRFLTFQHSQVGREAENTVSATSPEQALQTQLPLSNHS